MGHCLARAVPEQVVETDAAQRLDGFDILFARIPYPAWRLLMDSLQDDSRFCHCAIPHFHTNGDVTVHIVCKEPACVRHLDDER